MSRYAVQIGGDTPTKDYPLNAIASGEIGFVTASPDGTHNGKVVIGACHTILMMQSSMGAYFPKPVGGEYRYRPLAPGESVTFTRPKD